MRRRFGRGRRRSNEGGAEPIDAERWLARLIEVGAIEAERLEPVALEGLPEDFAALGRGADASGRGLAVAFAPERGADAALAALAWGVRLRREGGADVRLIALAPDWNAADRRRLALLAAALPLDCLAASALVQGGPRVRPEPAEPQRFDPTLLAGRFDRADAAATCRRALAGLEGLAAKHGGALRGVGERVELVVLCRRAAALVAERGALRIEVYEPERASLPLPAGDAIATALDRLEGLLRKLLNDRRLRTAEGGVRAALGPLLERAQPLAARIAWPLGGPDGEPVDWVGLGADGRCSVGASRERLGLTALAEILDGAARAPSLAAELGARAGVAPSGEPPRLRIAATEFDPLALDAIAALGTELELFAASTRRNGEWALEPQPRPGLEGAASPLPRSRPRGPEPAAASAASPAPRPDPRPAAAEPAEPAVAVADTAPARAETGAGAPAAGPRFEEVSLFDLDEESGGGDREDGGRPRRRRRRRGGRRSRGGDGAGSGERSESASGEPSPRVDPEPRRRPRREEEPDSDDVDLEEDDAEETLAPLAEDAPDLDEPESGLLEVDEEEDADDGEGDRDAERARRERELRRRARVSRVEEPPPAPRRRAAFLAHADPVSVLTAVILARDVRLVEGFWVYPQSDLMTFFRSVATDLGEQTPIFLVGFAASPPARDTLQSASLYRGRLDWFDHHDWPPEDLEALRATLGEEHVHVQPGAECSLAPVIAQQTRRSRFSDKLMELVTGRFTQHDYERWGRWWWHHLAEIAARPGDRKSDIAPLLAGRPSDLAKAVARAEEPPLPPELDFVSGRDFRLVHFGGLSMVVLEVPEPLDLHLCARIARERYEAQISLAAVPGRELVVLGADDSRTKRSLDLGALAAHLDAKHVWVESLADDDHVARLRISGLREGGERLDELITEIAMGRSIVEG